MKENRWQKGLIVMGGAAWVDVMVKLSYIPRSWWTRCSNCGSRWAFFKPRYTSFTPPFW